MNMSLTRLIENVLPPFVVKTLRDLFVRTSFRGDYPSFSDALRDCGGVELIKNEKYVELAFRARPSSDAVPFGEGRFMQALGAFALPLARRAEVGRFRVLDFGGGPGPYYFFMRTQMPAELSLEWHIFDTAMMAAQGRKTYSAEPLRFVSEWDDIPNKSYDVILASNALQCFDNPWIVLDRLTSIQCSYLVLHEIPVISAAQDRITIQRPPRIPIRKNYRKANFPLFPTWFFAEEALLKRLAKDYAVKIWWHSGTIALLDGRPIARKSYLLEKK